MKWIGNFDMSLADITSVVAGTGLSGGGTTGAVTLNVDASIPEITTLAGLTAIGTAGATLTTTSYSVFDVDRTSAQGNAGAENIKALHVDFDRAAPISNAYNHRDLGVQVTVDSASLGTSTAQGMDIDVVGATSGISTATGITVDVSGADTNIGMDITTLGTHLRLFNTSSYYTTFNQLDGGDLTVETSSTSSGGDIVLKPTTGSCKINSAVDSSSEAGGTLNLISNDGSALGDDHLLGKIGFQAAEDGSSTIREGAAIKAFADATWSDTVNDTRLEFYTMDGNNTAELSLTLDSNKLATFTGGVTVTGAITGDLTGQADTVATIAGLAPNTATTQATQPNIESIGTDGDTLSIRSDQLHMLNDSADTPVIKLTNTTNDDQASQLILEKLRADDGVAQGQNLGEIWFTGQNGQAAAGATEELQNYAYIIGEIDVSANGEESGELQFGVASHAGLMRTAAIFTGGSEGSEVDATIGLGANSVVTIPGNIDLAGDIDVDGTLETDALTIGGTTVAAAGTSSITTLGTIATGVWNGTKITDIYTNSSGKRYGNTIKILPSDFMINDDAAVPLSFKDGSNSGVHINDTANEAIAFVTIPEGMKATYVDVYATNNKTLKVWAPRVDQSFDFTGTTLGTGACNTQLDITDTNATAENYLAIQVTLTATTNRIWGGLVTIAPQ